MDTDDKQLQEINEAIEDGRLDDITPWESDFVDSITDQIDVGGTLTRKQREILDRIHEKIRPW
jgi:hypothetical protein